MTNQYEDFDDSDNVKSKSELKREMEALQKVGESLLELSDKELKKHLKKAKEIVHNLLQLVSKNDAIIGRR